MNRTTSPITVVTGLPRSGTSMLMRQLQAGGMATLSDGIRGADSDNPNGYYEYEPVKETADDRSWLGDAEGKVVKMVYRLVYELPATRSYTLLWIRRPIGEVLASQRSMLARLGKLPGAADGQMARLFADELEQFGAWLRRQPNIRHLELRYSDILARPGDEAARLNRFLGGHLDVAAMAAVVDPTLYRQRAA